MAKTATLRVVAPSTEDAATTVEQQLAEVRAARRELDQEYKQRRRQMDSAISRLERAKADLRRRGTGVVRQLDAARQAGKRNVQAAREAIKQLGEAPQSEIGSLSGVGTGSLTWAIRALIDTGEVEPTGERVRGSAVYRYVPPRKRARVVKPGEGE